MGRYLFSWADGRLYRTMPWILRLLYWNGYVKSVLIFLQNCLIELKELFSILGS